MQTFLPYPSFAISASVLDSKRLGNQCYRECKTILSGGWRHHPASKMWRGYESSLAFYALTLVYEMELRGLWRREVTERWKKYYKERITERQSPPWLGDPKLHRSHQSNLLRKDPVWYGQFNWDVPDDLPYYWPEV